MATREKKDCRLLKPLKKVIAARMEAKDKVKALLHPNQCKKGTGSKDVPVFERANSVGDEESDEDTVQPILSYIYENVVGKGLVVQTPYGAKEVIYCDYTASGKPLKFIEEFISDNVHAFYGNTHTSTSLVSQQTTLFREESRQLIRQSVNATDDDAVIFTGAGVTGAIYKLLNVMELHGDKAKNTTVIVSPYEHHSNMLMWKAAGCPVIRVRETTHGLVDLEDFKRKLKEAQKTSENIICTFSAASNVTGIMTDTLAVTRLAHEHGALMFWDYATAGPYLKINMNTDLQSAYDAIFLSPHKFVGGPGTPGLLIAKKKLFKNARPTVAGGGTVLFVTRETESYIEDIETREEGGTPPILESIRCGLVFQLKDAVGAKVIEEQEEHFVRQAMAVWKPNHNLQILGSQTTRRLPIFSFVVMHPETGKFLHHNFISTLLNDLYGIQTRGGCACAGPYAEDLLDIDEATAVRFTEFLVPPKNGDQKEEPLEIMKPGFVRLNLPYFMDDETAHYVIEAVDMVALHGWRLLPEYSFDEHTGAFRHLGEKLGRTHQELFSLKKINYGKQGLTFLRPDLPLVMPSLSRIAEEAMDMLRHSGQSAKNIPKEMVAENEENFLCHMSEDDRKLLWFLLPSDALKLVLNPFSRSIIRTEVPFTPRRLSRKCVGQACVAHRRPVSYSARLASHPELEEEEDEGEQREEQIPESPNYSTDL